MTIKTAMESAASRGKLSIRADSQRDLLGGEFPVHDVDRNEGGLLHVRLDGIQLLFSHSQVLFFLPQICFLENSLIYPQLIKSFISHDLNIKTAITFSHRIEMRMCHVWHTN